MSEPNPPPGTPIKPKIHDTLRIPRDKKGPWVRAARQQGEKLNPWLVRACDAAAIPLPTTGEDYRALRKALGKQNEIAATLGETPKTLQNREASPTISRAAAYALLGLAARFSPKKPSEKPPR